MVLQFLPASRPERLRRRNVARLWGLATLVITVGLGTAILLTARPPG